MCMHNYYKYNFLCPFWLFVCKYVFKLITLYWTSHKEVNLWKKKIVISFLGMGFHDFILLSC